MLEDASMGALLAGVGLAVVIAVLSWRFDLDSHHHFFPLVLVVVALFYPAFSIFNGDMPVFAWEFAIAVVFVILAFMGYETWYGLVALGLLLHGFFDLSHDSFIVDPNVPIWWPGFCAVVDWILGLYLAAVLWAKKHGNHTAVPR